MFCSQCGKECAEGDRVCGGCGSRLKGAPVSVQFDPSAAKGVLETGIADARKNWSRLGGTSVKLAAVAGLLLLSLLLLRGELVTLSVTIWAGYSESVSITGLELVGGSGFLSFLINLCHIVAIAAVAAPFFLQGRFHKNLCLPATITGSVTFMALILGGVFQFAEAAEELSRYGMSGIGEYIDFSITGSGWLLLLALIALDVVCIMATKDLANPKPPVME